MSRGGLSAEDRDAIDNAAPAVADDTEDWEWGVLYGAVGRVVDRHVAAALTEAADAIEAWERMSARRADDPTRAIADRTKALQRMNGYHRSACIVRGLIPPP